MKKLFSILIIIVIVAGGYYYYQQRVAKEHIKRNMEGDSPSSASQEKKAKVSPQKPNEKSQQQQVSSSPKKSTSSDSQKKKNESSWPYDLRGKDVRKFLENHDDHEQLYKETYQMISENGQCALDKSCLETVNGYPNYQGSKATEQIEKGLDLLMYGLYKGYFPARDFKAGPVVDLVDLPHDNIQMAALGLVLEFGGPQDKQSLMKKSPSFKGEMASNFVQMTVGVEGREEGVKNIIKNSNGASRYYASKSLNRIKEKERVIEDYVRELCPYVKDASPQNEGAYRTKVQAENLAQGIGKSLSHVCR